MSRKNGKDYLFLIWKQPESRRQYVVGILSKNGGFEFAYAEDIDEARIKAQSYFLCLVADYLIRKDVGLRKSYKNTI